MSFNFLLDTASRWLTIYISDVTTHPLHPFGDGRCAIWGDSDNDGDLDLYLSNSGGSNVLLENRVGSLKRWLHVDLVAESSPAKSTRFNSSNSYGIGARISVVAGGIHQTREISTDNGQSVTAEFGLGGASVVDTLVIQWPSGTVDIHTSLAADRGVVLTEGVPTTIDQVSQVPAAYKLYPNVPNPFNPVTTIRFELPRAGHVRLAVYDVTGRVVAELTSAHYQAGEFAKIWDGRDRSGREVASGIYFAHMEAEGFAATRKMVLLR